MALTNHTPRTQGPFSLDGKHVCGPDGRAVCLITSDNPADEVFVLSAMNSHHRARPAYVKDCAHDAAPEVS